MRDRQLSANGASQPCGNRIELAENDEAMAQGRSALSDSKEYPPKRGSQHLRCFSIDRRGYSGLDQEQLQRVIIVSPL